MAGDGGGYLGGVSCITEGWLVGGAVAAVVEGGTGGALRQRWWDLVELWATERWGGIVGGETTAADLVWQATGDATGGGRPLATNRDWPLAELDRALLPKG